MPLRRIVTILGRRHQDVVLPRVSVRARSTNLERAIGFAVELLVAAVYLHNHVADLDGLRRLALRFMPPNVGKITENAQRQSESSCGVQRK